MNLAADEISPTGMVEFLETCFDGKLSPVPLELVGSHKAARVKKHLLQLAGFH